MHCWELNTALEIIAFVGSFSDVHQKDDRLDCEGLISVLKAYPGMKLSHVVFYLVLHPWH